MARLYVDNSLGAAGDLALGGLLCLSLMWERTVCGLT